MFTVNGTRFNEKARVPFVAELAREFNRTEAHIWYVCVGVRSSPLRDQILARQADMIRENPHACIPVAPA